MRKKLFLLFLALLLVVVLLPAILVGILNWPVRSGPELAGEIIRVYNYQRNTVEEIPLEEYLVGVVAAEMPASFQLEALKAQAVAARTYTLKKVENSGREPDPQHPDADICTDPEHCQAWISKEEMQSRWGILQYFQYLRKVTRAVSETKGQVLTYNGLLIDPVYHANGGGRTEDSEAVWQYRIPYLRSVESPWDSLAPRFKETVKFSAAELDRQLGTNTAKTGNINLKILSTTASGRAASIEIGGRVFKGTEFRRLLELKSTLFSWDAADGKLYIETYGSGHGVGMSQYGANGMAAEGKSYAGILKYYYSGAKLQQK